MWRLRTSANHKTVVDGEFAMSSRKGMRPMHSSVDTILSIKASSFQ
jgi:hypothetical protein